MDSLAPCTDMLQAMSCWLSRPALAAVKLKQRIMRKPQPRWGLQLLTN